MLDLFKDSQANSPYPKSWQAGDSLVKEYTDDCF